MVVGSIEGISTDSIVIMTDSATAGSKRGNMGWLRSLPFLSKQGVANYTFPKHWLHYNSSVTFNEILDGEDSPFEYAAIPSVEFSYYLYPSESAWPDISAQHLCQFTSQQIEEKGDSSTTQKLIRAYNEGQIEELLIVVDSPSFRLDGTNRQKSLTETLRNVSEFGYEGVATHYIRHELPTHYLPLNETLNVWLHEAAIDYVAKMDQEPTRIADLFEFSSVHPDVRTWDFFEFLTSQVTRDETNHIQATIRPWVEADITKIQDHILNELQEFEFDADQVRAYREKQR